MQIKHHKSPVIALALDTIVLNKQALIFVNSKSSAEKTAEEIAYALKKQKHSEIKELAEGCLTTLDKPTKQCERLASCLKYGIAFHHAGLHSKQRTLIEEEFKAGKIKIIACTPTLCVSSETNIWTPNKEVPVSKLKIGENISSLKDNHVFSTKVINIINQGTTSELIEINTINGRSIKLTHNHTLLLKRKGEKVFVSANKCLPKDKIATLGRLELHSFKKLLWSDFVKNNKLIFKDKLLLEEDYYAIGAMMGDGYSGAEIKNNKIFYKGSPTIVGKEEVLEIMLLWCKQHGIAHNKKKNSYGIDELVLSKANWLREFFVRTGIEKGKNKFISSKILSIHPCYIAALLRGLFDTDGYVLKRGSVGISSISLQLITNIQKCLLYFGIVGRVRSKPPSQMKIHNKTYQTKEHWELSLALNESILRFNTNIGFALKRKQKLLDQICLQIKKNLLYVQCHICNYKIYSNIFTGRNTHQKLWGEKKKKIITLLANLGPLTSKELTKQLGYLPRLKDLRLNRHYVFINKKKKGSSDWIWSLNSIGTYIYNNVIKHDKDIVDYLIKQHKCPLCNIDLEKVTKKGWKKNSFEGDIFWDIIRSVKTIKNEKLVYDLVLDNNRKREPVFLANGIFVHNSAGINLPSFRAIIKDLKRFNAQGMDWIPILEYQQMAGRCGRPDFNDAHGEAIAIAVSEKAKDEIFKRYIYGDPENIYSKLAVEPVFRTYVLSLIATNSFTNKQQLASFFEKTFWAYQYKDMQRLRMHLEKILGVLSEWKFIDSGERGDFVSASLVSNENYSSTPIGKRVAELYLDPLTAFGLLDGLKKSKEKTLTPFSFLHLVSCTLEMRPLLRVGVRDMESVMQKLLQYNDEVLKSEPPEWEYEYELFIDGTKTSLFLQDWIDESDEDTLYERYGIRPGEIHVKLERADWLLFALGELAKIAGFSSLQKEINHLRIRLEYGVKEELLPLIKFKGIGKTRARILHTHGIKDVDSVKKAPYSMLSTLVGKQVANSLKEQVGMKIEDKKEESATTLKQWSTEYSVKN